jgi:hypothetical protein
MRRECDWQNLHKAALEPGVGDKKPFGFSQGAFLGENCLEVFFDRGSELKGFSPLG